MTRRIVALAALVLLAGCGGRVRPGGAGPAPAAGGSAWLAGMWIPVGSPADRDRRPCAGDVGILFRADGRYQMLEEDGRWAIVGDRLTMTATRPGKPAPPEVARVERIGDAVRLTYADGHRETLGRCP